MSDSDVDELLCQGTYFQKTNDMPLLFQVIVSWIELQVVTDVVGRTEYESTQ